MHYYTEDFYGLGKKRYRVGKYLTTKCSFSCTFVVVPCRSFCIMLMSDSFLYNHHLMLSRHLCPVVQNFASLTLSLRPHYVNYMYMYISTSKANTLLFFVEKICENPLHFVIFSTKNNSVFVILPFEILINR